jgi:hypothetical protein
MTSQRISALARPMVFSDITNVAIIAITLLSLASSYIYLIALGGYHWSEAIGPAISIAFSVFIAWALSREINPDFRYSAFFGVAIYIILMIYLEYVLHPHYLKLLWVLLFQRLINRSIGYKAKPFDTALILGLSIWLSFTYSWLTGLIAAFAFLLDSSLKDPHPQHKIVALFALFVSIVSFFISPNFLPHIFNSFEVYVLVIVSVLFIAYIFMYKEVNSKADFTPAILDKLRLRFTQAFTLVTFILFSIVNGVNTFYGLAPLWCAMGGVFIHTLFVRSSKKTKYVENGRETTVR